MNNTHMYGIFRSIIFICFMITNRAKTLSYIFNNGLISFDNENKNCAIKIYKIDDNKKIPVTKTDFDIDGKIKNNCNIYLKFKGCFVKEEDNINDIYNTMNFILNGNNVVLINAINVHGTENFIVLLLAYKCIYLVNDHMFRFIYSKCLRTAESNKYGTYSTLIYDIHEHK